MGVGVSPYKSLMGMCRWMGSHFHDWIDCNGVAHFLIFGVIQFFIFKQQTYHNVCAVGEKASVLHSI